MRFAVTGGSGFVGSHLVKRLLTDGHKVTVIDLPTRKDTHRLTSVIDKIDYKLVDLENLELLRKELDGTDVVVHFSASANTFMGSFRTDVDLRYNTITTYNILEAMRTNEIKKIIISSSPAVYGMTDKIPTPEDKGPLLPVSLYGAAKLASEGLISAFSHLFGMKAWIFRFGNVVGTYMTRGVVNDFILKLKQDPKKLKIMGDGLQKKDVIFIDDCIDGIMFVLENSQEVVNLYNLSSGTTITINKIAQIVIEEMDLKEVLISHSGEKTGWAGDVPTICQDISKIRNLGWKPKYDSEMAVRLAIKGMLDQKR
jgi:UDP-glucose 4-epimerase